MAASVRASSRTLSPQSTADTPASAPAVGYLRTPEAAAYLGISISTLNKLRSHGGGPQYFRPAGTRICLYRPGDLDAWVGAPRKSTSADPRFPAASART
jgi:hypothetical protein